MPLAISGILPAQEVRFISVVITEHETKSTPPVLQKSPSIFKIIVVVAGFPVMSIRHSGHLACVPAHVSKLTHEDVILAYRYRLRTLGLVACSGSQWLHGEADTNSNVHSLTAAPLSDRFDST